MLNSSYSFSQDYETKFIKEVAKKHSKTQPDRLISKTLKDCAKSEEGTPLDSLMTIYIPSINFSKKINNQQGHLTAYNLLYYLNIKKFYPDIILVFRQKKIIGYLSARGMSRNDYVYINKSDMLNISYSQLADEIPKIEPDFMFSIYNLPMVYWYVKNEKLYALSYQKDENGMVNLKSYEATYYINNYLSYKDIIYFKKVIVY